MVVILMKKGLIFQRYELKYKLTEAQYQAVFEEVRKHTKPDVYGQSTIQSLYFDTDDFLLIRRSIEKPGYKEKLRMRSYGLAKADSDVFLEIKKKAYGIVFKRRIKVSEAQALKLLKGYEDLSIDVDRQIAKEICWFAKSYPTLSPKMLLLYDRTAWFGDNGLRITFDENVRYRTDRLTFSAGLDGTPVLNEKFILMEIKTSLGYPKWLIDVLNSVKAYKTSFSKYGQAYKTETFYGKPYEINKNCI